MDQLEENKNKLLEELVRLSNDVLVRRRELDELCRNRTKFLEEREAEEQRVLAALRSEISAAKAALEACLEVLRKAAAAVTAGRETVAERRLELERAIGTLEERERTFSAERAKSLEAIAGDRRALDAVRQALDERGAALAAEVERLPPATTTFGITSR